MRFGKYIYYQIREDECVIVDNDLAVRNNLFKKLQ